MHGSRGFPGARQQGEVRIRQMFEIEATDHHLISWTALRLSAAMPRPADECPYPTPFPADFNACPASQARQFIPLDTMDHPLEPVLPCRPPVTPSLPHRPG